MLENRDIQHHQHTIHLKDSGICRDCHTIEMGEIVTAGLIFVLLLAAYQIKKALKNR